ncbi:MAG: Rrf2 family transcriptional regulator [Eggerthellaceae bacterium]|nr:Rrf2 family transcriptional regulator [Eggerthellaceae bacterium]
MKLSTKGLYAVRLMLHLAERGSGDPISLKDISQAQHISKKYLEQIVPNLVSAHLLRAQRGSLGGYLLAKRADKITVYDVLVATEGSLSPLPCVGGDSLDCTMPTPCLEANMWKGLERVMREYLEGITLQQIIDRESAIAADSYSI